MTDLDRFTKDVIRTESKIGDVDTDFIFLEKLLSTMIKMGTVLDQVKKNVFYGKQYKTGDESVQALLSESLKLIQDMLDGKGEVMTVNVINPRVFHGIVGVSTESTELLEAMHTAIYTRNHDLDVTNIGEELFDCTWYQHILYDALHLNPQEVMDVGLKKLKQRYPDKFDSDRAINRDTTVEREILDTMESKSSK